MLNRFQNPKGTALVESRSSAKYVLPSYEPASKDSYSLTRTKDQGVPDPQSTTISSTELRQMRPGSVRDNEALPPADPGLLEVPGYPALAKFMGSDDDFMIFRAFKNLAARNLIVLQDELAEMEEQLNALDLADARLGDARALWNLHSRREDSNTQRHALLFNIRTKLAEYR